MAVVVLLPVLVKWRVFVFRLHEQLNESDDAAQCYIIYIQDIFSCGVSYWISKFLHIMHSNIKI